MAHGEAEELTGRRRYRRHEEIRCGGLTADTRTVLMILEVEVSYFDYSKREWSVKWRDATPADLPRQEVVDVGS